MRKVILAALFAGVAFSAEAAEWKYLGFANGHYLSAMSPEWTSKTNLRVWITLGDKAGYSLILEEINCKSRFIRSLGGQQYNLQDNVVAPEFESAWVPAVPHSMGMALVTYACESY